MKVRIKTKVGMVIKISTKKKKLEMKIEMEITDKIELVINTEAEINSKRQG